MKIKCGFTISLLLAVSRLFAGEGDYAVSKIPAALLENADAVKRVEEQHFEIIDSREAVEKTHYVITILNENGDHWANFQENYTKFRSVLSVEGTLYDAFGKQLKRTKNKDIHDISGVGQSNLIDDLRLKHHNFYHKVYPYTIEYFVEVKYKFTLFFPAWIPVDASRVSVEQSTMTIESPADYVFRYKAYNYPGEPATRVEKNQTLTSWSVKAQPAILREPFQPTWDQIATMIIFGPSDFEVDDYKGSMNSWQDLGKFIYTLKQGKDQLPEATRLKVRELIKGATTTKQKIQSLYEYMQKNTRYISIQLGVGGWQPFDASFVATKGYGDCKALTNYMYSLLKEAGIVSYYTVIRAGDNEPAIRSDFPSQQFNHVILCAMAEKDTVWLECTDQTLPAGYLGEFTSNRYGLMVDESGGKLVRTPHYGLGENLQLRRVTAKLGEDATLFIKSTSRYEAEEQDDVHALISQLSRDKVKEYLHQRFNFGTYEIATFNYKENRSELPSIEEQLEISVSNYATITGKRLFIIPNIMTRTGIRLQEDAKRKYDVVLNAEYREVDSVEIELPEGYELEARSDDVNIAGKFGKYSSVVKLDGRKLYYYRHNEVYAGHFSPKEYPELVKYHDEIYKSDRRRLVFVKKN